MRCSIYGMGNRVTYYLMWQEKYKIYSVDLIICKFLLMYTHFDTHAELFQKIKPTHIQ